MTKTPRINNKNALLPTCKMIPHKPIDWKAVLSKGWILDMVIPVKSRA